MVVFVLEVGIVAVIGVDRFVVLAEVDTLVLVVVGVGMSVSVVIAEVDTFVLVGVDMIVAVRVAELFVGGVGLVWQHL